MSETNTAKVSILGEEYTLRGYTDIERITELAQYVDQKLRQAKGRAGQPQDMTKVAILTSLNIAFELFQARSDATDRERDVATRAAELADRLNRCLIDGADLLSPSTTGDRFSRGGG